MKKNRRRKKTETAKRSFRGPTGRISVRWIPDQEVFELVHPPCARRRADDIEEVRAMLAAGEVDVAVDELRWLLTGCRALLEAHQLLGEIALANGDLPLARGHFGYAFEQGAAAIPNRGLSGPLPAARAANGAFFTSGKGLAQCLKRLGQPERAAEVVRKLLALDPADPLDLKGLLEDASR